MFFLFHQPTFPTSKLIESITYFHSYSADHPIERLLPDGFVDFIINLEENPKCTFDNDTLEVKEVFKKGWISGARTSMISIDAGGSDHSMMVIRITKGASYLIFGLPMNEITDRVLEADVILGNGFLSFREALVHTSSPAEKVKLAETYVMALSKNQFEVPPVVSYTLSCLSKSPISASIETLVSRSGYSHKHFISQFRKYTGMSPKEYAKITRFQTVLHDIETRGKIDWSRIALECGYYDQAHFIKEFKLFSGISPEKYLVERGDHVNYLPVYR